MGSTPPRRRRLGQRLVSAPAAPALLLLLAACGGGADKAGGNAQGGAGGGPGGAMPPPLVRVVTLAPQTLENVVELPGRIQAFRTAEVRARVDGIVERRLYEEGSDVRAGTPLFRIDPKPLQAVLAQAQAQLARARATATNASQVVARYAPLVQDQAVSKQENDAAVAAARQASADVAQAAAQVQTARLNLGYALVTAPISGRVSRAEVTEGALVSASGATLLTKVEQLDPVYVNFAQSNSALLALRRDIQSGRIRVPKLDRIQVQLVLEDGSVYPQTGHLNFLDLSVDESTGSVSLRAIFPNPRRALLSNQFVRARLRVGVATQGISVPQRAVIVSEKGSSVYVVGANGVAMQRQIDLGDLQGDHWVIRGGLKPGDRVIVDGTQKVKPGAKVRIDPHPPAAAPAAPAPAAPAPGAG